MWDVMDSFGMDLTRILRSCGFVKVGPLAVQTVIGLVGGILFWLGVVVRRYMDVSLMSATPKSLSLFSIFCCVGR